MRRVQIESNDRGYDLLMFYKMPGGWIGGFVEGGLSKSRALKLAADYLVMPDDMWREMSMEASLRKVE